MLTTNTPALEGAALQQSKLNAIIGPSSKQYVHQLSIPYINSVISLPAFLKPRVSAETASQRFCYTQSPMTELFPYNKGDLKCRRTTTRFNHKPNVKMSHRSFWKEAALVLSDYLCEVFKANTCIESASAFHQLQKVWKLYMSLGSRPFSHSTITNPYVSTFCWGMTVMLHALFLLVL